MATEQDDKPTDEQKLVDTARHIGVRIDEIFNPKGGRRFGFVLMLYEHSEKPGALFTYISNSERGGAINATKEWIASMELEGHPEIDKAIAEVRARVRAKLSAIGMDRIKRAKLGEHAATNELDDAEIDEIIAAVVGSLPGAK